MLQQLHVGTLSISLYTPHSNFEQNITTLCLEHMHTRNLLSSSTYFKIALAKLHTDAGHLVSERTIYTSYVYNNKCLGNTIKDKYNSCKA
jgi:hypothetical protein